MRWHERKPLPDVRLDSASLVFPSNHPESRGWLCKFTGRGVSECIQVSERMMLDGPTLAATVHETLGCDLAGPRDADKWRVLVQRVLDGEPTTTFSRIKQLIQAAGRRLCCASVLELFMTRGFPGSGRSFTKL